MLSIEIEPELLGNKRIRALCAAIRVCAPQDETLLPFMRDLLTARDLVACANIWAAAGLVYRGMTVRAIAGELGIAEATVVRARRWARWNTGGFEHAWRALGSSDPILDVDGVAQPTPRQPLIHDTAQAFAEARHEGVRP